jgi:hypothetical protein
MKRFLIASLLLVTGVLSAQTTGILGQLVKWDQITGQPEYLLSPVTLERGEAMVPGGAVVALGGNAFRIHFNPGGGGIPGGGGNSGGGGGGPLAVEAGMVAPWAGSDDSPPEGWLVCDGSLYETNAWPELYKAIERIYTPDTDDGDKFRVPDYRGKVLEGVLPYGGVAGNPAFPVGYMYDPRIGPPGDPGATLGIGSINPSFMQTTNEAIRHSSVAPSQAVLWLIKARTHIEGAVMDGAVMFGDAWAMTNNAGIMELTVDLNSLGGLGNYKETWPTNGYLRSVTEFTKEYTFSSVAGTGFKTTTSLTPAVPYWQLVTHWCNLMGGSGVTSWAHPRMCRARVILIPPAGVPPVVAYPEYPGAGVVVGSAIGAYTHYPQWGAEAHSTFVIPPNYQAKVEYWVFTADTTSRATRLYTYAIAYRLPLLEPAD